eukprot:SAG31_NODE_3206_length_4554_cov_4.595960_3_plen_33_part_00
MSYDRFERFYYRNEGLDQRYSLFALVVATLFL